MSCLFYNIQTSAFWYRNGRGYIQLAAKSSRINTKLWRRLTYLTSRMFHRTCRRKHYLRNWYFQYTRREHPYHCCRTAVGWGWGEVVGGGGGGGEMWEGAKILRYRDRFSLHHCWGVVTTIHVLPKATGSAPSPANYCRYPLAKTLTPLLRRLTVEFIALKLVAD